MNESKKQAIIRTSDELGFFYTADDGFVYFWPNGKGGYDADALRIVANELDCRNADLNERLKQEWLDSLVVRRTL